MEPLLLTHALTGAQKAESSKLHDDCVYVGTLFVPGRNIKPIYVQRSQLLLLLLLLLLILLLLLLVVVVVVAVVVVVVVVVVLLLLLLLLLLLW